MTGLAIAVVGSANLDRMVVTDRLPRPGETLTAREYREGVGGKGANQAMTIATLGTPVGFVGCVGADAAGDQVRQQLAGRGVDLSGLAVVRDAPTGTAQITVDGAGENVIVVHPGANAALDAARVDRHRDMIAAAALTLMQCEVGTSALARAAALTRGLLVLNPAPATPLPDALVRRVDVLVPNRSELAVLAGTPLPESLDDVASAVGKLGLAATVVVTLGTQGAAVIEPDGRVDHAPALRTEAVDTTGAGDCFCGALATALVGQPGRPVSEAARWAAVAASLSTRGRGAQGALPTPDEVYRAMNVTDRRLS
ncbi:ribokinase [Micromonospora sp. DR5-3]|uniref:ribokinase n=1 Tax=unclassified Micromonospora TaxID=2617518 RepID=UPI0011D96082|nr:MULTISPECIES: ribokinase [unclassified Micromonospora]MCW3819676.1 ribokinase [Micromonospora sp. DR5-3]TYC19877.1 ribokinase [Micromonospora sp. MP36]